MSIHLWIALLPTVFTLSLKHSCQQVLQDGPTVPTTALPRNTTNHNNYWHLKKSFTDLGPWISRMRRPRLSSEEIKVKTGKKTQKNELENHGVFQKLLYGQFGPNLMGKMSLCRSVKVSEKCCNHQENSFAKNQV